tara:strand:- start:399 stop:788 length:390 start_codon:yes stop_codon:yes gene_type:complete
LKRLAIISFVALGACAQSPAEVSKAALTPAYQGIETRLLDGDLVNFRVQMTGAASPQEVIKYAQCAAAQYTLIRGYGFLRHVRTNTARNNGLWSADAVYTISPSLPRGLKTIDAEVAVADCGAAGIPTV